MQPLSVTIISKNEIDRIEGAITSVDFADEIVVLDSGSDDGTPERARILGARVVETDWPGHIAQKNRALSAASHDWVLSIDCDERVTPTLAASIQEALRAPEVAGYAVNRLSWWQGAPLRYGTWHPDWRVRLFDRRRAHWAGTDPHDAVEVDGATGRLEGLLEHHPYRDLGEHHATIDRYATIAARAMAAEGRSAHWWDVALRPPLHFVKAVLLRRGILDGRRGVHVAALGSRYVHAKWSRLYGGEE